MRGADWHKAQGLAGTAGLKFIGVSGDVVRPGVYEVPMGTPVSEVISRYAGGLPSGKKLKAFAAFLRAEYHGSLAKMFRTPTPVLRAQLLTIHGIGPETADCILLYAGKRPIFVVDAYTRRLLERHGLADRKHSYEEIRQLFERSVPADVALYNEFHALIVQSGKHYCRARDPRCDECALNHLLPERSAAPQ